MDIFLKLKNLDRRWVYLCVALSVILPMIFKFELPIYPGAAVKGIYNKIESLEPGSRVFLSFDFDPAAEPELGPGAIAIFVQMFRRNIKPIIGCNWPVGSEIAEKCLNEAKKIHEATYEEYKSAGKLVPNCVLKLENGKDYVNLGYKPGGIIHVKNLCTDFMGPYPQDREGTPTENMSIFKTESGRRFSMNDISLIISYTAGTNGIEAFISNEIFHKRPMAAGCTSVNIPRFTTYLQTGQLVGMIGGLPGAAEYESLVEYKGEGRAGMSPQSIAHLVIMIFIILGNLAFIAENRKTKKKKA
ncbi:MAG: hypothetical protein IKO19_11245 [Candidatus Riflebacteria bacterium]|nr:hypothetical protein [Candidatus Riflebacteria bacterium]MBR4571222.1 hypothetical protein [Candidatus Riflebacteria bacterium]